MAPNVGKLDEQLSRQDGRPNGLESRRCLFQSLEEKQGLWLKEKWTSPLVLCVRCVEFSELGPGTRQEPIELVPRRLPRLCVERYNGIEHHPGQLGIVRSRGQSEERLSRRSKSEATLYPG